LGHNSRLSEKTLDELQGVLHGGEVAIAAAAAMTAS
jgi:hypothetical protein